ncbi:MAG: WD40/YVTN/BNR-like repeat-containing protein, partial [Blastocatellia bacterium]
MVTMFGATGEDASSGSNCRLMAQNGQLRKSTDGGATWSAPLPAAEGFCGAQCRYDIAVAVDPSAPARVYIGGSAESSCSSPFKRSTDGGTTFSSTDDGLHADMHSIVIAPSNPSIIYTGNDGGIFRSTDRGTTWQSLNTPGFSATQFQSIAVHPTDPNFFIGGTQDNGSLVFDSNRDWRQIDFGDGGYTLIDQNATNTKKVLMYHTYFNVPGTFLAFATIGSPISASAGNWTVLGCGSGATSNGIGCSDTAVLFYAPMALGPGNPNTVYFGTDRLYRSPKKGKKMKVVSQGPIVHGVPISSIGISPQDDNIRIVGVADGEVFASTDGSSNMTEVTSPDFPSEFVARAVIDPHDSNTAYVTFSGFGDQPGMHVWKTSNLKGGASTWVAAGNGIPDAPVSAFVIDPANSGNLYAGTDIGVFRSTDGGATWIPFSEGLPKVAVFDMAIQRSSRT